jgi:cardiolipin synthase (CMP-forming)
VRPRRTGSRGGNPGKVSGVGQIRGGGTGNGEGTAETSLSAADQPVAARPASGESATNESPIGEPATSEPATSEPATVEPTAVEPATIEPPTVEPPTVEPPASEPPASGHPTGGPPSPDANRDRILTIPNGLSVLRLIGVPVFLWLVLGPHLDAWAVVLLIASAATDWLDGKIARAFNQQSKLGEALDPAADRLYIAATLVALAIRNIIPWWLVALLAVRELVVAGALGLLKRKLGFGTLQVSFVGKTATLCLLYAFPLLLLGTYAGNLGEVTRILGWAFACWGTALYWWAAALYLVQARDLLTGRETAPTVPAPNDDGIPQTSEGAA